MHRFKLANDDLQPVYFEAENCDLKLRLNSAYLDFVHMHEVDKVVLYVHHPQHEWLQVCDHENRYLIIGNPMLVDNGMLARAVAHTLWQANGFPSEQQIRERKSKALEKEHQLEAERRRNAFRVIESNPEEH